jgi:hypothetical protein
MAEVLIEDIISSKVAYNDLHTDYKAEIVALNLLKHHRNIDQVFIKRVGSNERPFSKDIKSIQEEYDELDERNVVIETHREGLYDYLPEGLFYPPSLGDIGIEIEAIRNRIQQQRQVERDARKLFQPFEMESSYVSLNGLQAEGKYTITEESNMLVQAVSELWPLIDLLDKHTAKTFVYLLPFFHSSRGNKGWFEKCMGAFLQVPVKVTFVPNHINDLSDSLVLSQMQLGVSSMLSGSHFDGERNWAIHYGPIPYQRLSDYVPGSKLRKLLQALYDYCLPATVKVEEAFITEKQVSSFSLVDDGNNNLLGYSTFL